MSFTQQFLSETIAIAAAIDASRIDAMAEALAVLRANNGRLFCLGVGGGAAHASHAVCDFRKLASLEAYCPSDNVAELSALTNDEGWEVTYVQWLYESRMTKHDALLVFSVGGGDAERAVSKNVVRAVRFAKQIGATVLGIVGRDGGETAKVADVCVIIPTVHMARVTPHTESWQSLIAHLLVSHPLVQMKTPRWESLT